MSPEKSEGIVVRQVDFSESSRVVTFFTREHGKVATLAKGAKRLKGPFQSALDLLATCHLVFLRKSSSSLDILTDAQLLDRFEVPGRRLESLYSGYYVAELLDGLTEEYDPHPTLYDTARTTLVRLQEDVDPQSALVRFQLLLLREIGLLPNFEECLVTGESVETGPDEAAFALWVSQGGLISSEHRPEAYRHRSEVDRGTLRVLIALADEDESVALRTVPTPGQLRNIQHLLTAAISSSLGRRPRMLRYLRFPPTP